MELVENQRAEDKARDNIDKMLRDAGWVVHSKGNLDFSEGVGVAIREYPTDTGPADYVLFVDKRPVGIIEAKNEEEGLRLTVHEEQSTRYANAKLKYFENEPPLPFVYETTGIVTHFTDYRDPKPRAREVFSFYKPETLKERLKQDKTLRNRLQDIPDLKTDGLRNAQIDAINGLEQSFKKNNPRSLIHMATGAGKTFTAITSIYRLLKFAKAKRVLFLVDTKNLGEQAEQEFMNFTPNDENRKFTELYNVQRLGSSFIPKDAHVCISTIQRLYSILKGEELDEFAETVNPNEDTTWLQKQKEEKKAVPVEYTPDVPIETFDFIVIDECHRSIYNLWTQVLDYFDSFLIGLTATPDKRTYGFFNGEVVSEYSYEQSVIDGVNVPYETFKIETKISKSGSTIEKGWTVERRDKVTRAKRWNTEEEQTVYKSNSLDKDIVNKNQIRTIIQEFKRALEQEIFPNRVNEEGEYEVPKTLIFAKTDSHADDIIKIVREVFGEGNEFCKKVTYGASDPKSVLNRFRNSYYPRIAVTVDMIATGTDVKPLEVLLFMRRVASKNYYKQMVGRGTRTINPDDLKQVTSTAKHKTHFVLVDAVGLEPKEQSGSLEKKPNVSLKDLLEAVLMGVKQEDLFSSLANRLIRLNNQISDNEKGEIKKLAKGKELKDITQDLVNAFDPDVLEAKAKERLNVSNLDEVSTEEKEETIKAVQEELADKACNNFNGKLNEYLENVRKKYEQIIDTINQDEVLEAGWIKDSIENSEKKIVEFHEFLKENKDEITALSIFYNQPYRRREVTLDMIQDLFERITLKKPEFLPERMWAAYETAGKVKKGKMPGRYLTSLFSLVRHACGIDEELQPYNAVINRNFQEWIFKQNEGQPKRFTPEQTAWLKMIKEHVLSSFHISAEDLEYTPFDAQGGLGKMYQLFGEGMNDLLDELNEVLAA